MAVLPDLTCLTHEKQDALIRALWAQVQALTARVTDLEAKLNRPPRTPGNSSLPPSKGQKPNRPEKGKRHGPRPGSVGRIGWGRTLAATPDEIVAARPVRCAHCQAALGDADHILHGRYDKIDLPQVVAVVTRMKRYAGHLPVLRGHDAGAGAGAAELLDARSARLHPRNRGRRPSVRPAHEGTDAAARRRARPTELHPGPEYPSRIPLAPRVRPRRRHGIGIRPPRRPAADLFAGVRSVISTAAHRGMSACQAIQQTLRGQTAHPG